MTAKQICVVLFPADTDDEKNVAYIRQLILDLKNALKMVGRRGFCVMKLPIIVLTPIY